MIGEFIARPEGAYSLTTALAVAVGLVVSQRSVRAGVSSALVTAVFLMVASARVDDAPFAAALYVVIAGTTALLVAVSELRDSPLLVGEPRWRKVLLVMVHERAVREADRDKPPVG